MLESCQTKGVGGNGCYNHRLLFMSILICPKWYFMDGTTQEVRRDKGLGRKNSQTTHKI